MVFELCERWSSLGVQALRAVSAEFHEDAGTASLAADSVSFAVERFEVSAVGALVVNEFNHTSLSVLADLASCFEPFIGPSVPVRPRTLGRPSPPTHRAGRVEAFSSLRPGLNDEARRQ